MKSLVAYRPSPIVPGPPIRAVVLDSMGTSPDEILAAGIRLDIDAVEELAVVGDTVGDLIAGTRAGASVVAGILGGAADADELASAPHTHLLLSVAGLPEVLLA